jgi:hypothetical protein
MRKDPVSAAQRFTLRRRHGMTPPAAARAAGIHDSRHAARKKSGEKTPIGAWIIRFIPLKSHLPKSGAALHRL